MRGLGITVTAVDGRLRCTGPAAHLKGEAGEAIRARKAAILACLGADSGPGKGPAAAGVGGASSAPLGPAQARLWLMERLRPEAAHHIPFAIAAEGRLDRRALRHALAGLMARHDVLRLRLIPGAEPPLQHFPPCPEAALPFREIPLSAAMGEGLTEEALIAQEAARPFDLTAAPPLRLTLLERGETDHIILFTLHHIACDGSSVEILMADFGALYLAALNGLPDPLPPLPVQYGDHARRLAAQGRNPAHRDYWQTALAELPVTRLPADFPRPAVQALAGAAHPVTLPAPLVAGLRAIGAARGASLFAVLLTAFKILVARHSVEQAGDYDLVIGTPAANRTGEGADRLIGLFVNPLPIRSRIDPGQGFTAALARVREAALGALDHQDMAFEQLVEAFQPFRDPGASPLFQIKFQLDRAPRESLALPGLTLRRLPAAAGAARHDLSLDLTEDGDAVRGHFAYATALFRPETVAALAERFLRLLTAIAAAPEQPVALLPLLTPQEEHDQRVTWNATARPIDPAERFPALFEAEAARAPSAVAVEYVAQGRVEEECYGALNARANRLAHALRARGIGREAVVGIALPRGRDMVAAWLGVMKAGAAWLPLDPAYPAGRIAGMLADSGAVLVLTHAGIALPDAQAGGVPRLDLDRGWPEGPAENPEPFRDPQDLAYLIYTSGSTGRPKGVEVPHEGLVNLARDKFLNCDVRPGDRVFSFFSFSFDAAIPDLVMGTGRGGRLILTPAEDALPGPGLARILRERRATHLTITPSALANLPEADLPDLRMVLVGGEAPSPELIARWSPGRRFINAYGPTEATVNASMVVCGNGAPVEPTLRAPANKQLHVLDPALELRPVGVPGELHIGGIGLARGYRGRPGLTARAFLPDPTDDTTGVVAQGPRRLYRTGDRAVRLADGRIRLLGRIDDQVKIRGFRIEPGEIARLCETHPGVESAVVAPREVGGRVRLVAWLVAREDEVSEALRAHLTAALPRHMIPDDLIWIPALPLTVNGKLDLRALPDPVLRAGRGPAPRTDTERAVAAILADLLGLEAPGAEDDFFDLGGNSLMATRLVSAIEARFGVALRALDLFEASTVAGIAARIEGGRIEGGVRGQARPEAAEDWRADLALAADIRPSARRGTGPVLLTGATGFLGAHLLAALLEEPGREVLCLVRRGGGSAISGAISGALARYRLAGDLSRIRVLEGDLSLPDLGLSDEARAEALKAGAILHAGARVHHLSPYRSLRAANVGGTVALLGIAAEAGIPFHHVSTLSALTPPGSRQLHEQDAAHALPPPQGGYNITKWVAERLVAEAAGRGLAVTIHRLGSLSSSSLTGAVNPADILATQLRGYLASGLAPEGEALVNILPVDHVARAILLLSGLVKGAGGPQAETPQVFHHTHAAPVSARLLLAACAAEGRPLRRIPAAEWQAHLARIAREEPDHPLHALAALGTAQGFSGAVWPHSAAATCARLGARLPQPPIDEAMLRREVRAALHTLPREEALP